jgi:probable F420-dependent oxidoreductase
MRGPLPIATFLPTSASEAKRWQEPAQMIEHAQLAEALGFAAVWVGDHYVTSPVHGEGWLDPMMTLAYLAGGTSRIGLGPAILVTPIRQPVFLAKECAAVQSLSKGRFTLSMATGFSKLEFGSVQIPLNERGRRQDEIFAILRKLLNGEKTGFEGKYYSFPELLIEPIPQPRVPIWIAGGSQPDIKNGAPVAQRVIDRIAQSDGWITVTYAPPEMLARDCQRIRASAQGMGRDPDDLTFAHMNFVHLVETDDDEKAHAEQYPHFMGHFGGTRTWEVMLEGHLLGGISEIARKVRRRVEAGCNYLCIQPVVRDYAGGMSQLKLVTEQLVPAIRAELGE